MGHFNRISQYFENSRRQRKTRGIIQERACFVTRTLSSIMIYNILYISYQIWSRAYPASMIILNFQSLMLQSYQPKQFKEFLSLSFSAHTSFPTGICCVLTGIMSILLRAVLNCSANLVSLLLLHCSQSQADIPVQRQIILLFLSVLPVSNPSLLVHSTSNSVFLPGHVLRSANRLLRINKREDLVLRSHFWASVVTGTTVSLTYLSNAQTMRGFFYLKGRCKHDLVNTREFKLRKSRSLKIFTCSIITSLQ